MEWLPDIAALLAVPVLCVALAAWRRQRARLRRLQPAHERDEREAGAVLAQARIAAAYHALGKPAANPHADGTPAHALWEAQFHRALKGFTQEAAGEAPRASPR